MKNTKRRQFLSILSLGGISLGSIGLSGVGVGRDGLTFNTARAHHTDTHFDEQSKHKLVYQLNKIDHDYIESILFSCAEMLRKYGDDIELVIAAFGSGIHVLAKKPERPVSKLHQQRVQSLMQYGVRFQACGNTMKSLSWTERDIVNNVQIVDVGVDGIMQLQEQGFAYISM